MRSEWQPEELIEWTLLDCDRRLVANKSDATRLGFALMLKFFELEWPASGTRGLQVVEHWNSANTAICYGKNSD